ncbi:hypothetical protein Pcinc_013497 [Petrolisthes cinctipes]|uniref:Uncharacterized protein n=1 Tax=Petrolisthes cinctipes TaxID=88211 RepID=A0AAE1KQA8_PETCI|nr:hypothetical protein Pcinc_013497 [Petrolisthes cinctipes]
MSHLLGTPTVEADPEPRPLSEWERTEKWRMQQEIKKRTTAPAYITQATPSIGSGDSRGSGDTHILVLANTSLVTVLFITVLTVTRDVFASTKMLVSPEPLLSPELIEGVA